MNGQYLFRRISILILFLLTDLASQEHKSIDASILAKNALINSKKCSKHVLTLHDSVWIKVQSPNDRNYQNAVVYTYNNKIIKTTIKVFSPSYDWESTLDYFFNETGDVEFIYQIIETYLAFDPERDLPSGTFMIEKKIYCNVSDMKFDTVFSSYHKQTKEKMRKGTVKDVEYGEFMRINEFPFYEALYDKKLLK